MSHSHLHTSFIPISLPSLERLRSLYMFPDPYPADFVQDREIFMPAFTATSTEGKIVDWVKPEGDKLSKGESDVVVESDMADMDVEPFCDGYVVAIVVEEGLSAVVSTIALLWE